MESLFVYATILPNVWKKIRVEMLGDLAPTSEGNRCLIFAVDTCTYWTEARALANSSPEGIARFLLSLYFRFGRCEIRVSKQTYALCQKVAECLRELLERDIQSATESTVLLKHSQHGMDQLFLLHDRGPDAGITTAGIALDKNGYMIGGSDAQLSPSQTQLLTDADPLNPIPRYPLMKNTRRSVLHRSTTAVSPMSLAADFLALISANSTNWDARLECFLYNLRTAVSVCNRGYSAYHLMFGRNPVPVTGRELIVRSLTGIKEVFRLFDHNEKLNRAQENENEAESDVETSDGTHLLCKAGFGNRLVYKLSSCPDAVAETEAINASINDARNLADNITADKKTDLPRLRKLSNRKGAKKGATTPTAGWLKRLKCSVRRLKVKRPDIVKLGEESSITEPVCQEEMSLHADHSAAASGDSSIESALFDETTDSLLKESRPLCEGDWGNCEYRYELNNASTVLPPEQSLPPGVFDWRNSDCTLDNEGIVSQLSSTEESLPPSTDDFRDCEGASTSGSIVSNTDGFLSPDADHSSICDSIPNSEDSVTPSKEFLSPARVDLDNCECTQNSEQVCPDPEERPSAGTADFSNCESTLSNESPPVTPSENFRKTLAFDPAGSDKHLESEKEVSPGSSPSKSTARLSPGQITSTSSSPVPPAPARLSLFTPRSVRMKLEVPIAKKGDTKALYEQPTRTTIRTEVVGFSKETEYDCLLRNAGPGELLNFYVVEVEKRSPACYVWISKKPLAKCPKEISRMNYALKRFYSCIPWSASTTARIFIGQAVAVRLKRDEWVRGRVLSVENTVVELSLVDMGGTYSANLREIRILDEQFFTPKGLVWRAEIAGLDPFRYDTETANHLSRMLKERNYLGTIVTLKPVPTIRLFDDTCYRRPVEISAVLFQTLHLPETEEIRLGVVIHICSNSSVNHLLLVDVRHLTELEKIQRAVESAGKAKIPLDKDSSDSVVAVERNGVMCRGMILNRIKEDRALVELFDFGHRFVTRLNNLYRLPGNVRDLPSVTLWCVVSGVSDISNHSRLRCILKGLVQKTVLFEPLYYLAPQQAVVKLWDDKMQPLADQLPADDNILMDLRVEDVDWPLEYHEHQMLHAEVTNTFDNAHDGRTILGAFLGSYNSFGVEPEEAEESEEREESSAEVDCSDAVDSDEFMSEIQCECKLPSSRLKSTLLTNYIECPEKNTLVCALSKEMNKWCRAIIYEKKGAMDDPTVYLIDLGQWEVLPLENLRPMRPEWMKMPWRSSMLHVNEFVMASLSEGKWLISKTFPLEQIQKSKEYRFVITKTEAPFFHGILIMEDVIDLNDSGKQ